MSVTEDRRKGETKTPFLQLLAQLRVTSFGTFCTEYRHLTATSRLLEPCRPRAGTLRNQEPGEARVLMGSLEHGSSKNPSPL